MNVAVSRVMIEVRRSHLLGLAVAAAALGARRLGRSASPSIPDPTELSREWPPPREMFRRPKRCWPTSARAHAPTSRESWT